VRCFFSFKVRIESLTGKFADFAILDLGCLAHMKEPTGMSPAHEHVAAEISVA